MREGRIHNYLRMLWGNKILEWTRNPRAALQVLIELNNRWALAARDPNSYSGIFWTLGRYDIICTIEAPNEAVVTALGLTLGKAGNPHTETLRAFSAAEMAGILDKVK